MPWRRLLSQGRLQGKYMTISRKTSQSGSVMIEFAISMSILIPLFFGMLLTGITAGRGIQAMQFTRDLGHMYGLGVDFSQTLAQNTLTRLAQGLDTSSTGSGVIIFSQIKLVAQSECDANSVTTGCRAGQYAFSHRLTLGNASLRPSNFGTPDPSLVDPAGNIAPAAYLVNPAAAASNVGSGSSAMLPTVPPGSQVWVCESYFALPAMQFLNAFGIPINGVYSVTYF